MLKVVLFSLESSEPVFLRRMIRFIAQKNDHSGMQKKHGLVLECHVYSESVGSMNYASDLSSDDFFCLSVGLVRKVYGFQNLFITSHTEVLLVCTGRTLGCSSGSVGTLLVCRCSAALFASTHLPQNTLTFFCGLSVFKIKMASS